MLVFFVLLTVMVQLGFYVVARNAAAVAVQASTRAAAREPDRVSDFEQRLERDVSATIPGAEGLETRVVIDDHWVTGTVAFDWAPPGPQLLPIRLQVTRSVPIGVPP